MSDQPLTEPTKPAPKKRGRKRKENRRNVCLLMSYASKMEMKRRAKAAGVSVPDYLAHIFRREEHSPLARELQSIITPLRGIAEGSP